MADPATITATDQAISLDADLIACLAKISRWAGQPKSTASLTAGMAWRGNERDLGTLTDWLTTAAERAGFDARVSAKPTAKLTAADLPAILIRDERPVLVISLTDQNAILWHPERGRETQPWSVVCQWSLRHPPITVQPTTDWQALADASARADTGATISQHWFWGPVTANRWIYAQVALASLMINIFGLATPLFVMNVYDRVLPNAALETGWALGLGALIVFGFDFVLRNLRAYFIDVAGRRADLRLAGRLFDHVLDIKLDRLQGRSSGALANMLREFEQVRDFFTSATLAALVDLPFIFLFLGVIYLIGGSIAFGLAMAVAAVILIGLAVQWPLKRLIERAQLADDNRHGMMVETLNGLETIRSTNADRRLRARYADLLAESTIYGQQARFWGQMGLNTAQFMQQAAAVFVVLVGMYLVADGTLTVGGLIACVILGSRAIAPLSQVSQLAMRFQQARHALIGLNKLMQEPVERPAQKRFLHRDTLNGTIQFTRVEYRYPTNDRPVLRQVSFAIAAGEKVGLIGRVGSGKSTVAKLIAGLTEPQAGMIQIDGTDIGQIDPADLRRHIALVPQDTFLLRGSLRDNLSAGRPEASDQEILAAATLAGLHDMVGQHPRGYDLPIGERGMGLSGGQRQLVAIARAVLSGAETIILDEATSALDTQGETALANRLATHVQDRTLVVITHRHSLLTLVDRLIVLDHGQIVADGPRDEVIDALSSGKIAAAQP